MRRPPAEKPIDLGQLSRLLLPALSSISTRAEMAGLARALSFDHRCIVPDHVGMGLSDRPDDAPGAMEDRHGIPPRHGQ